MNMGIFQDNKQVVIRTTLRNLTEKENQSKLEKEKKVHFDSLIKNKLGDSICDEDLSEHITPTFKSYIDEDDHVETTAEEVDDIPDYDGYIASKIVIPAEGGYLKTSKVTERVIDDELRQNNTFNPNPYINSREYEGIFDNDTIKEYSANVIAKHLPQL